MAVEPDKRELILARLNTLFGTVEGVADARRNDLNIPEKKRPAVVTLDADESADDEVPDGRGRAGPGPGPAGAPIIVTMTPEVYILTGGKAELVGTALNALRLRLIKAVLTDETLLGLVKDRDIRYMGFATGFAAGRSLEGEAGISFRFRYTINPTKI